MTRVLYIDVYDAAGNRLGPGPVVAVRSVAVRNVLDGVGKVRFALPGTDERMISYLQNETRPRIFYSLDDETRELGRGIMRRNIAQEDGGGWSHRWEGPDNLDELNRRNTFFDLVYDDETVQNIVADLVSNVPGWSSVCTNTNRMSVRFDGMSILNALLKVAQLQGLHVRLQPASNVVDVGSFGDVTGIRAIAAPGTYPAAGRNPNTVFIRSLRVKKISEAVANRIVPIGAGQNIDSALTLELSTRTGGAYEIKQMVVNGRSVYYLEDVASISTYGVIEKVIQIKDIGPLSSSEADKVKAANALYDAAVAWLQRHKDEQTTYALDVTNVSQSLRAGDKIRLVYKGLIEAGFGVYGAHGDYVYRDIDEDLWILEADESITEDGEIVRLTVSNVDRYEEDAVKIVVGVMEEVRLRGLTVQPTINHWWGGPEQGEMNNANSFIADIIFDVETYQVDRVLLQIRTRRFTNTVIGGAESSHKHRVGDLINANAAAPDAWATFLVEDPSGSGFSAVIGWHSGDQPSDDWLSDVDFGLSAHTHDLIYGIFRDDSPKHHPEGIDITVNGLTVATNLAPSGGAIDEIIDITDAILARSGGIHGAHPVEVSCTDGQGEVRLSWSVNEQIIPFQLG